MPRVLVCFAVAEEAAPFRRIARRQPGVEILVTGMGPRNAHAKLAARLAQSANEASPRTVGRRPPTAVEDSIHLHGVVELKDSRPGLVLSSGFAGALNPSLATGTVVYQVEPQSDLAAALQKSRARPARFINTPVVLATAVSKQAACRQSGADAVDMESAALRELCAEHGVAFGIVRVISDAAGEDLPLDFGRFMTASQSMNYPALLLHLARYPALIPALWRFRGSLVRAAEVLALTLGASVIPVRVKSSAA